MAKYTLAGLFNAIAKAIRYKTNTTDLIKPEDFPDAIYAMHTNWDATISSGDQLLKDATAYGNGIKYIGTIPTNNEEHLSISHNTITTEYGYYDQPTSKSIPVSILDNTIISGSTFEEEAGDYAWRSTVEISEGYHNQQTLVKIFSNIFPGPETPGSAEEILAGYQFYNSAGKVVTGIMANNAGITSTIINQHGSFTIPKGYHDGTGKVVANIISYDGKVIIK